VLGLTLVLLPIALIDSISPVRIGAMVTILCGDRFLRRAFAYLAAIFIGYFGLGIVFALGGKRLLEIDLILDPTPINFVIGLLVGILLILVGLRSLRARQVEGEVEVNESKGAAGSFVTGLLITIATAPTSVPLLAAVNRILRAEINDAQAWTALAIYCIVFLTPLIALLVQRAIVGDRAEAALKAFESGAKRWMGRLLAVLFIVLGLINVIDALGFFFFDRPLL